MLGVAKVLVLSLEVLDLAVLLLYLVLLYVTAVVAAEVALAFLLGLGRQCRGCVWVGRRPQGRL